MGRNADVAELLTGVLDRTDELDPALVERIEGLLIRAGAVDLTMTKRVLAIAARHFDRFDLGESFDAVAVAPALAWTGDRPALGHGHRASEKGTPRPAHPGLLARVPGGRAWRCS